MSNIDKQALREEFRYMQEHYSDPADRARQVIYIAAEALLDELETKEEQRANWFQMAQKLGEDLDAAEKRNAEQREYYEGVITDGSKRIAELEKGHQEAAKQINSWRRLAKQNIAERGKDISELEAARQRIAELEDAQCQHESDTLMLCHQFDELASAMGWTSELAMKQGVGQLEYARSIKTRIAELENSETQLINERDAAESALADMYQAATGERPEWSNMFGFADAVDVVEERLATLEANQSQTTPTGIQLITEAIGAHGYIVGCLLQGRPDLALEESRKWVSAFGQAAEIVSAQDAAGIKVKES